VLAFHARPATISLYMQAARKMNVCGWFAAARHASSRHRLSNAAGSSSLPGNQDAAAAKHAPRSKTVQQMAAAGAILAMSGSSPLYRPRTPAG
jgi:hypothetical protein